MTEVEQVVERWRRALQWRPDEAAARLAAERGRTAYRGGWPGFPPAPFALEPPPAAAEAGVLLAAYADFDRLDAEHFEGRCPPVKMTINHRLKSTGGRIDTKRRLLELNWYRLSELPETRIETVFHELVHLWLYALGLPCGHTPLFRAKMAERGHISIHYGVAGDPKGPRHAYPGSDRRVIYRCPACGHEYRRRQRFSRPMLCGVCLRRDTRRERLTLVGQVSGCDPR